MTIEDLVTALEAANFDVHFGEAPDGTYCPYLVFTNVRHPNFAADNKTFSKTTSLTLRLVESEVHDWTLIDALEQTLDELNLPYEAEDLQLQSEHVCETQYNIRFLGGNKNA